MRRARKAALRALAETARVRCDEHHDAWHPPVQLLGRSAGIIATGVFFRLHLQTGPPTGMRLGANGSLQGLPQGTPDGTGKAICPASGEPP